MQSTSRAARAAGARFVLVLELACYLVRQDKDAAMEDLEERLAQQRALAEERQIRAVRREELHKQAVAKGSALWVSSCEVLWGGCMTNLT